MRVTSLLHRGCCWKFAHRHGRDDHHGVGRGGDTGDDGGDDGGKGGSDSGSDMGDHQDDLLSTRYPRQTGTAQAIAVVYVSGKPVPTRMGSQSPRRLRTSGVGEGGRSG